MTRSKRLGIAAFLGIALVAIAFVAIFGVPPSIDPEAQYIRWKLMSLLKADAVEISEEAEWAGADHFRASIYMPENKFVELRDVSASTLQEPAKRIILSGIANIDIRCSRRLDASSRAVVSGVNVVEGFPGLPIRQVTDLLSKYGEALAFVRSWPPEGFPVEMVGAQFLCRAIPD